MGTTSPAKGKRITVDISPDQLTASIRPISIRNKEPVTEQEVLTALALGDVAVDDAVRKRVEEFVRLANGKTPPSEAFIVATGQPPEDAKDEEFVWDPSFEGEAKSWQDDAQVNYYTLNSIITVQKDTTMGTISPPTPAREGIDVKGCVLRPARIAASLPLELDGTLRRSPDDPTLVISNVAGKLVQNGRKLTIEQVLTIKGDVGFATGNIDSVIAVSVMGAIPDRFETKSTKSITVKAAIEAATVATGGDVVVRGGIVGRNAGSVVAGGNITAKFCSEADLTADGDVMIGKQVMSSKVRTRGKLIAEHAAVIGGHVYAAEGVDVAVLGSERGTPTRIFVGVHPETLAELAAEEERLRKMTPGVQGLRTGAQPMIGNAKRPAPAGRAQATEGTYRTHEGAAHITPEGRRERAPGAQQDRGEGRPRLRVSRLVCQGVTISLGKRVVTFHNDLKGPVVIEEQRIKNVTEAVAVNQLTGSVLVLKSRQLSPDDILRDFEPLAARVTANATR